jgi:EAL domain-containing protein (putative c-di-GMP-specific phosphodiesterase class I)
MIRELIDQQALYVNFQPIVDLTLGGILGYEVLGRMRPSSTGCGPRLNPAQLLQIAHEERCLIDLEHAWRAAAIDTIARADVDPEVLFFVNVDARMIEEDGFAPGFTRALLDRHGLSPEGFVFEMTEAGAVDNHPRVRALVRHYASQGFRIALDDLGSGRSSLRALAHLDPDVIKVDAELVAGVAGDALRWNLLAALSCFCRQSGKLMIAEGIENLSDLSAAVHAGVLFGQGFLLGKPTDGPERLDVATRRLVHGLEPHLPVCPLRGACTPGCESAVFPGASVGLTRVRRKPQAA